MRKYCSYAGLMFGLILFYSRTFWQAAGEKGCCRSDNATDKKFVTAAAQTGIDGNVDVDYREFCGTRA